MDLNARFPASGYSYLATSAEDLAMVFLTDLFCRVVPDFGVDNADDAQIRTSPWTVDPYH